MLRKNTLRLLLLSTLFFISAAMSPLPADDKDQIAELEKRVADLQKQLAELKKKEPATASSKKLLGIKDADTWRSIRAANFSGDGKWFAHRVGPNEGDGEVILRNVADGKETKFPAGGGFGQLQFSFDSKWLAFSITPYVKPGGPPGTTRPKSKLVLVNLANLEKTELEGVSSGEFSGEAATHLVYRKSGEATPVTQPTSGPPGPSSAPPTAPTNSSSGHTGTDLVLRNLGTGLEVVFGNVADYSFNKQGNWLVTTIDAAGQTGNGVYLHDLKTGTMHPVEASKAGYRNISWNEDRTAFVITKSVDDPGYEGKWISIIGFTNLGPTPTKTIYDPKSDKEFPTGFAISSNRIPSWSDALDALNFGIAERKKKEEGKEGSSAAPSKTIPVEKKEEPKKEETAVPTRSGRTSDGAKPDLVIWHWKDERLQPMQALQATTDKMHTYAAEYRVKEKKFYRLSDDAVKSVSPAVKQRFAIGRDVKPYEYMSNLDGRRFADIYVTDLSNGARKKALTKQQYVFSTSPTGTHFLYYQDGHYFAYDMGASKSINLTSAIKDTSFIDDEDDHNMTKPPHQSMGWSRDGSTVILFDGWDLWAVKVDGTGGKNLTVNGKKDRIRYQGITQYEPEPKPGYDFAKPLYVTMFGEFTKKGGIGRIGPNTTGVKQLLWGDYSYGLPIKARQADVFAYTRQSAIDSPDYYLTDASFKDAKKITDSNPQQKDYAWCSGVKIMDYTGTGGKKLQGTLYLPANYDAAKKYPTVIYIYEKLTQGTNQYTPPSFRGGFNKSIYTSNGYAVLTPDITYRVNDPGKSSVECILPALDAAIATGVVDGSKVGLHGHSWGGYQTAFAITQTKRFACAIAGAPLTDLISMYSSVYWNSGSANQPIFESSQGRFTAGYWDQQDAYIRNSPVYFAKNVATPLLLLHNDKDGAVDFTQGVEYYNTLRRLQKPVVMLQYKGENHGLAKTENQKDYAVRMREFFDHYLMGKPAPEWWKDGVPHLKMDEHLKGRKQ